jgi:hypothetical protein
VEDESAHPSTSTKNGSACHASASVKDNRCIKLRVVILEKDISLGSVHSIICITEKHAQARWQTRRRLQKSSSGKLYNARDSLHGLRSAFFSDVNMDKSRITRNLKSIHNVDALINTQSNNTSKEHNKKFL